MQFNYALLLLMAVLSIDLSGCGKCKQIGSVDYFPYQDKQMPFAEAVRVGHLLILSGQLGIDPKTDKLVEGKSKPRPGRRWRTSSARSNSTASR